MAFQKQRYEILPETKPTNLPRPSDDTQSNDTEEEELPELTPSQAKHINIPLQKINSDKQQTNRYGTVSDNSSEAAKPQLKLQVDDKN